MGHIQAIIDLIHLQAIINLNHLPAIINLILKAANNVPHVVTPSRGDAVVIHGEKLDHLVIGVDAHMESTQEI